MESPAEEAFYVKWQEYFIPGMKYLAFLVLFLLVYLIFLRPIRKRVSHALSVAAIGTGDATEAQLPSEAEESALPGGGRGGEIEGSSDTGSEGTLPATPSGAEDKLLALESSDEQIEKELLKEASIASQGNRKTAAIKRKLVEKAKNDPETVSQLLRSVLREGM